MSMSWELDLLKTLQALDVGRGFQLQEGVIRNKCFIHVAWEDLAIYVERYMEKSLFEKARYVTKYTGHYTFELRNFAPNWDNQRTLFAKPKEIGRAHV